jgi:hypothetical protein
MGFYDQGGMARVRAEDLVPLSVKKSILYRSTQLLQSCSWPG